MNGGESFIQTGAGQITQNRITWQGGPFSSVHVGLFTGDSVNSNRNQLGWIWDSNSNGSPVSTNSIVWDAKTICSGFNAGSPQGVGCSTIQPGNYKIYIGAYLPNSAGYVEDMSDNSFTITSGSTSQAPVISGGTFPTTLNVGQTGTWTVNASDPQNGSLSYSVDWGDTPNCNYPRTCAIASPVTVASVQSSTFTHAYSTSGTYTVTFVVKNSTGLTAQTSTTVKVNTVNTVVPPTTPIHTSTPTKIMTVVSPNGGEVWQVGSQQVIKWQDIALANSTSPKLYDIKLVTSYPLCTTKPCPKYLLMPYTIANSVSGSSYSWSTGKIVNVDGTEGLAPASTFTIQVCQSGTERCDSSDAAFKIGAAIAPPLETTPTVPTRAIPTTVPRGGASIIDAIKSFFGF
jgi:hypothetical protein